MNTFKITDINQPPLTTDQLTMAISDLYVNKNYPKVNRKFVDPVKSNEPRFALFSFIKSSEETSNDIFGVGKIRGVFFTQDEADARAEELIRDVDSCNSIFTCVVGVPFPLVCRGFSHDLSEIDLSSKVETAISENVRRRRNEEQKEMKDINERQQRLMDDVHPEKIKNDEDQYIEQRVKLAHLKYTISEHFSKRIECEVLKEKVLDFLRKQSNEHPEYEEHYLEKYMAARRAAKIPEDSDMTGFMKYMADPLTNE